jgi:hypothetical protein
LLFVYVPPSIKNIATLASGPITFQNGAFDTTGIIISLNSDSLSSIAYPDLASSLHGPITLRMTPLNSKGETNAPDQVVLTSSDYQSPNPQLPRQGDPALQSLLVKRTFSISQLTMNGPPPKPHAASGAANSTNDQDDPFAKVRLALNTHGTYTFKLELVLSPTVSIPVAGELAIQSK